ncbi:MAG TPA: DUF4349 domain-containing protein [Chitinophagaceae bacterium]|nr:DUF4349 domain-containing protein [Chitinophagaceae bacterium]
MKYFKLFSIILLVLSIQSCENKATNAGKYANAALPVPDEEPSYQNYIADSAASPQKEEKQQQPKEKKQPIVNAEWDKKIIKTALLNLEVKDYTGYYSSLREKIKNIGGYIAQEEQRQSAYKIENTLVIKVPVEQFDNALVQLTDKAEKLNEKKITSQDVSAEYIDTRSRMESKKQVRQQYIALLKQAKNMEDILNVQSEINSIQEEIEAAAGRVEYLGHSSAYSTINLTYYQVLNSSASDNDKPSFGTRISAAFKTGWEWITSLFVGLVSVWPLCLVTFFALIFYRRMKPAKVKQS